MGKLHDIYSVADEDAIYRDIQAFEGTLNMIDGLHWSKTGRTDSTAFAICYFIDIDNEDYRVYFDFLKDAYIRVFRFHAVKLDFYYKHDRRYERVDGWMNLEEGIRSVLYFIN